MCSVPTDDPRVVPLACDEAATSTAFASAVSGNRAQVVVGSFGSGGSTGAAERLEERRGLRPYSAASAAERLSGSSASPAARSTRSTAGRSGRGLGLRPGSALGATRP